MIAVVAIAAFLCGATWAIPLAFWLAPDFRYHHRALLRWRFEEDEE